MIDYITPKGTRVAVAKVARRGRTQWRLHTLRRTLTFDLLLKAEGNYLVFQWESWYVYAPSHAVQRVKRDDEC